MPVKMTPINGFALGPMFAALKSGTSVVLADGTVINPEQVLEEAVPGRYVAVICSVENDNHTILDELYSQEMFRRYCILFSRIIRYIFKTLF